MSGPSAVVLRQVSSEASWYRATSMAEWAAMRAWVTWEEVFVLWFLTLTVYIAARPRVVMIMDVARTTM